MAYASGGLQRAQKVFCHLLLALIGQWVPVGGIENFGWLKCIQQLSNIQAGTNPSIATFAEGVRT